tara:strand:- start:6210 stop:10898 length:4689 start_codon:yes stop_codon:yes gene_type:complete
MSQTRKSISKQILAWTAVFALVLSILPYSVADSSSNEYFESWSYQLSDTDGDGDNDTIMFTFDVDTNVTDSVEVEVSMNVIDDNGNYVGYESEDYEIYWTDNDTFEMEWFVDDCDDYDDEECEGPYEFEFQLYEIVDGSWYWEDNFTESNIWLYETTIIPEGVMQIENAVLADDIDGYHNDILFLAHMEDYELSNVTIQLERKVGIQWVDVGDEDTNEDGEASFKNMSSGEYRWSGTYDGETIDALSHTFVFYGPNSDENIGHIAIMDDADGDDDYDDFAFARIYGNSSESYFNDGVYVELLYESNNTVYAEKGGDGSEEVLMFNDVPEGNYTFSMYNGSSSGDLLQSGWMHSYGSLNTNYGEYFESWSNHTTDTNGDGIANNIFVKYNPDTECNCTVDVMVSYNIYDADTGMYVDYGSEDHEINGTEVDEFETNVFYAPRDSNYTFEFYLYDISGDNWDYEDNFTFTVYLECDSTNVTCDSEEYFESWSYHTNDTNGNGIANNLYVEYNPDTDCNCSVDITVTYNAISENGDYIYGDYYDHNITGTEVDNFTTDNFYPSEDANYTFYFTLYDNNWNFEDEFNFTVYLECDTEDENSNCDYDEWFEDWDYVTEDTDDDNLDDTIIIDFDPNTECDCEMDVFVYVDIYQNSSGNYVDFENEEFTINRTDQVYFDMDWTSPNSTSYDFYVYIYDDEWNFEDSFWIRNVYLYQTSGAGGPGDDDEYFDRLDHYTSDTDSDGYEDTVEFEYDPDTTCDCYLNVTTVFEFYDNQTGDMVDSFEVEEEIYGDDNDYFYNYWSPSYNGTFDIIVELYDQDGNLEDLEQFNDISLHVRSQNNNEDYYFSDWDHYVEDSEVIFIGYDPDTTCNCYEEVRVEIEVYDSQSNDFVDYIEDYHEIYNDDSDWFEQEWSAPYNGSFDFYGYLFFDDSLEDSFFIDSIYLNESHNEGSHSNNGIAHVAYIISLDEDDYVNDFIGMVNSGDEVFFEISHEDNVVESGYSNDGMWFAQDLQEGWYDFQIIDDHEEDYAMHFQSGSFYSYGNNSHNSSDIVNVGIGVGIDEDYEDDLDLECDAGPCDDVGIIAYIGDIEDGGVEDINFDIFQWNSEEEYWEYYVTLTTNESGTDIHHDTPCGEYMWMSELNGNEAAGRFDVYANCNSEEEHAWFEMVDVYAMDLDGNNLVDSINFNYHIMSDCDCDMYMLLITDIYNESGYMVDTFEEFFWVVENDMTSFNFTWSNYHEEGNYTFDSILEYLVDGDTNGEIIMQDAYWTDSYMHTYDESTWWYVEEVSGRDNVYEGQNIQLEAIVANAPSDLVVIWDMGDGSSYQNTFNLVHTYADSGDYDITIETHSGNYSTYDIFEIKVKNMAPRILNIMMDEIVNEGDEVSFNVQYEDVSGDMDNISVSWIFPSAQLNGNFAQYTFADDGEFLILVEIRDDNGGVTTEQRMVTVQNVAPIFTEFILPSQGEEGISMDFSVKATDPGDDTITYTFDFGDGTAQLLTQTGNASHKFASGDSFEIIICAKDEDGGETCRTEVIPVALLEEIEDSGLPGFGFLGVISALGAITLLRRRTH